MKPAFLFGVILISTACHAVGDDPCNPPREILVRRVVPPMQNPYPAVSPQDFKRVRLAEEVIRLFWSAPLPNEPLRQRMTQPHDPSDDDIKKGPIAFKFLNKRVECLRDFACWTRDYPFLRRIAWQSSSFPPFLVSKVYWTHVVPWSLRRYAERTLPVKQRTLTDAYRISEAAKADYRTTSDPAVFIFSVPDLRDDEYLVDSVVQMKGQKGYWHLLQVLSDDAQGEPVLRWFDWNSIQDITRWSCYH